MKKALRFTSILLTLIVFFTACDAPHTDDTIGEGDTTAQFLDTPDTDSNETTKKDDATETVEDDTGSKGLAFQPLSGGTCYISGLGNCTDSDIIIPKHIDGYKVTGIGDKAFDNCKSIKRVTIPDGVTSIGNYAFYKCTNLMNITIPKSVTIIGAQAFAYCDSLASITIPDGVMRLEYNTFWGCFGLERITIPTSVTFIDSGVLSSNHIKIVNFTGTQSQWNAITIYDYYYSFRHFTIFCTDGNILPE